jgi:tRNA-splicing ligase RtcB
MLYAQEYALENRKQMMLEILDIMKLPKTLKNMINENHNHAIVNGSQVLHRKGATPADKGQLGVIPGNMKDGVYITKGLGNSEYLSSASHGAGRKMARGKAAKNLDFEHFKKQMKGVVAVVDENILDESPDAYKDLEMVISKQIGIVVEVVEKAYPLINVKASEESHAKRKRKKKEERRRREEQEKDIW